MDFQGPEAADFCNVTSINHEFLRRLRNKSSGRELRQHMVPTLHPIIRGLTDVQIHWLATTPFLLLSLRERDADFWSLLNSDETNSDLFVAAQPGVASGQLAAASLAFLWQLARRNPYAARLVSGATLNWCEQLADWTLIRLLRHVAGRNDLLRPRAAGNNEFWSKLLGSGLSPEREVRRAAQLSALQAILTDAPAARYRPIRAAACSSLAPSLRVADTSDPP